ncbi:helix-turn-helix domain-containing protein, partial [Burkholderia glumae]
MPTPEQANVDLVTANKVRDLLSRHGIPPRSQNTTIA